MATQAPERLLERIVERLAELLEVPAEKIQASAPREEVAPDLILKAGSHIILVEAKSRATAPSVTAGLEQLHRAWALRKRATPLLAVPYMGEVGQRLCKEADVSWLDLSGNAHIVAPGLRIDVSGRPSLFKHRGRPASVFAPRSSRIARWLLLNARQAISQRELARQTGVDEGFTSRIVRRLQDEDLVVRQETGAVRAKDPDLLLDAWREAYDFSAHEILRGHVAARSSEGLLRELAKKLGAQGVTYAATGLGAAWLWSHFAAFRIVTIYLPHLPTDKLLGELGFRQETAGENVWLVVPNDEGVFHGAAARDGVNCVHPVQVYLDLKGHPERAQEAAARLREDLLKWRQKPKRSILL